MKYVATVDGQEYHLGLEEDGVTLDGAPVEVDLQSIDGGFHYSLLVGAASHEVFVERCEDVCFVTLGGQRYQVQVEDERARRLGERRAAVEATEGRGEAEVVSPMPGVVVAVLVEAGQEVRTGEGLLILEAMKMENEIRAPRTGVVEAVQVEAGQRVSLDDVFVRIGS
ncbi:MAG: biotin/lipoyl-binding protein [Anaerolineae bacterium]|jgi:pyruvate carboxylase subunit B